MNRVLKTLPVFIGLIFISCGDDVQTGTIEDSVSQERSLSTEIDTYKVAMDNTANDVNLTFEGYEVVVYSDKVLEDIPSQSSKAIYGNINGKNTTSLLSVSSNYIDGDSFKVKVYKNNKLVGESEGASLSGEYVKFNDIKTNEE